MNKVELEFNKCVEWYDNNYKRGSYKMIDRVIELLLSKPDKIWWWAWDVNNKKTTKGITSHRGSARLTDLAKVGICEVRNIGEYSVYRLKTRNIKVINNLIETLNDKKI